MGGIGLIGHILNRQYIDSVRHEQAPENTRVRPEEVSLTYRCVLFLGERPEHPRKVLESLRQPLEASKMMVARVDVPVAYPSRFQLVNAIDPWTFAPRPSPRTSHPEACVAGTNHAGDTANCSL
jgi:predicted ATPase with chaperone activity